MTQSDHPLSLSRRGLVLGGTAAGLGAAAVPLLGAGPADAAGSFRVATANIQHAVNNNRFFRDMGRIGPRADLIGLNEMYEPDRRQASFYWAAANQFHLVHQEGTPGTNAIMARASVFDYRGEHGTFHSSDTNGPKRGPVACHATAAKFYHKATGVPVVHIVTHLPPKIDRGGRPSAPDGRLRDVRKQLRDVLYASALYAESGAEVVVTGDFNVDYVNDRRVQHRWFPWTSLENRKRSVPGLRSNYTLHGVKGRGTHGTGGGRHIDYVYEWRRVGSKRRIRMLNYNILPLKWSDHEAVVASFRVTARPGRA